MQNASWNTLIEEKSFCLRMCTLIDDAHELKIYGGGGGGSLLDVLSFKFLVVEFLVLQKNQFSFSCFNSFKKQVFWQMP